LDLLDLPGLVVNQHANEPDSMPEDTHALVNAIIDDTEGRAVFLAVREIGEKAKSSQAINVLKRHPEIVPKTLGVFTKCDEATGKKIKNMSQEKSDIVLPLGNVFTMNAPPEDDEDPSLHAQAQREHQYFEGAGLGDMILEGRATCNYVVQNISSIYLAHLTREWMPRTQRLLRDKRTVLLRENRELGLPEAHDSQLRVTFERGVQRQLPEIVALAARDVQKRYQPNAWKHLLEEVVQPLEDELQSRFQAIEKELMVRVASCSDQTAVVNNALPSNEAHCAKFMEVFGDLLDKAVVNFVLHGPNSTQKALEADMGEQGLVAVSAARVGRFPKFIDAVVYREIEALSEYIEPLQQKLRRQLDCLSQVHFCVNLSDAESVKVEYLSSCEMVKRLLFVLMRGKQETTSTSLDTLREIAESMDDWTETCSAERIQLLGNIDHLETLEEKFQRVFDQDDVRRSSMDLYPWLREDFDLEQADRELRNDKEVVLIAVARDGLTLQHASVELRRDKEVVIIRF
jgi:hypothetical protein